MAYQVFISSVDDKDYQNFLLSLKNVSLIQKFFNKTPPLKSYKTFYSTSFLSSAKQHNDDFNNSLKELLFGGMVVDDFFWHPLSPAKYHSPSQTKKLYTDIMENHNILLKIPDRKDYDEYFESEVKKVLAELKYSIDNSYGLIIMYEKPHDRTRAKKTKYINLIKPSE
jgi:hypothetical protein